MIIPAIDMIGGQTVRLYQGDYAQVTYYDQTPSELVQSYSASGAELIHIVDLQGAKNPSQRQFRAISELAQETQVPIQTGGGIRSAEDVKQLLTGGVRRVIVGSLAIKEPELVSSWIKEFGSDHIVLALDVSMDEAGNKWLPSHGWQEASNRSLESVLEAFEPVGVKHVLCTDISRDGTLQGSNTTLYDEVQKGYPQITWQASGGIGQLSDVTAVARTGVSGIIVGKALLDGIFSFEEASQCWQDV